MPKGKSRKKYELYRMRIGKPAGPGVKNRKTSTGRRYASSQVRGDGGLWVDAPRGSR